FHTYRSGSALGFGQVLDRVPVLRRLAGKTAAPLSQRNRKLQPFLHPPLFGLAMYQAVRDSLVSLNIHADSSPRYASNMRLFEATGMGTCLLTDWRENLPELFHLDEEVVCYRSPEECVEKARWLCGHPEEAARIGAAGQRRTLKDHTFLTRAERLDKFIRKRI
ncbi:MAG: glycosyltransferase family protein, partial [Bdellovibrionota bacterium]